MGIRMVAPVEIPMSQIKRTDKPLIQMTQIIIQIVMLKVHRRPESKRF